MHHAKPEARSTRGRRESSHSTGKRAVAEFNTALTPSSPPSWSLPWTQTSCASEIGFLTIFSIGPSHAVLAAVLAAAERTTAYLTGVLTMTSNSERCVCVCLSGSASWGPPASEIASPLHESHATIGQQHVCVMKRTVLDADGRVECVAADLCRLPCSRDAVGVYDERRMQRRG